MSKCESCGSRQFVGHAGLTVCIYCRTEKESGRSNLIEVTCLDDSDPKFIEQWQANSLAIRAERLAMMWGTSIIRPESVVRISEISL